MRTRAAVFAVCALLCGCRWRGPGPEALTPPPSEVRDAVTAVNYAAPGEAPRLFPDVGNMARATEYYQQIAGQLGIPYDKFKWWTLDSVSEFLGYPMLPYRDSPCDLMQSHGRRHAASFRFFATKTSTVQTTGNPTELGWRQVIRLRSTPQSAAMHAGITSAFVLVNYQRPVTNADADPFAGPVAYFQVALLRGTRRLNTFPTYFMLFGPDHEMRVSVTATFFGGDAGATGHQYYVPNSCLHCHGGNRQKSSLNLLDVDHWSDRVKAGDDFAIVTERGQAVASTGRCSSTPMDVALELNEDIRNHNRAANGLRFVRDSLDSWIDKHSGRRTLSIERRAYGRNKWSAARPGDVELLSLLNRYCYRCHGSIRFDVFNRAAVVQRRDLAIEAIESGFMPLDRYANHLTEDERNMLIRRLQELR